MDKLYPDSNSCKLVVGSVIAHLVWIWGNWGTKQLNNLQRLPREEMTGLGFELKRLAPGAAVWMTWPGSPLLRLSQASRHPSHCRPLGLLLPLVAQGCPPPRCERCGTSPLESSSPCWEHLSHQVPWLTWLQSSRPKPGWVPLLGSSSPWAKPPCLNSLF